jgi:carbon storage regulator
MLVIGRRVDEVILINAGTADEIRIMVTKISPHRVALGIDAPESVRIHRLELLKRTEESNKNDSSAK